MYTVHLLETKTGKRAEVNILWDWDRYSELQRQRINDRYNWEVGSNACDCIRLSYLYPERRDHTCSTGRVIVEKVVDRNGTIVYSEEQKSKKHRASRKKVLA
jgi:hypothetical protein